MKILVAGFDPFGGEHINPAYQAVKQLPSQIQSAEIIKLEIPTSFAGSVKTMEQAIAQYQPDIVLNVGQAGGRSCMTVEKVAINLADARIPDNDGQQPIDQPLCQEGATAYFSTLPVKAMVEEMRKNGIPANVSYTAGTYVCNSIMYHVLHLTQTKYQNIRAGFIHVPYESGQAVAKPNGTPFMSLEMIAKGLQSAIVAVINHQTDSKIAMGELH